MDSTPAPFRDTHVWLVATQSALHPSAAFVEAWVLADDGQFGLDALKKAFPENSKAALVFAFPLTGIAALVEGVLEAMSDQGIVDAGRAQGSPGETIHALALRHPNGTLQALWARATSSQEAIASARRRFPNAICLSAGNSEGLVKKATAMMADVRHQRWQNVRADLRTAVAQPASSQFLALARRQALFTRSEQMA